MLLTSVIIVLREVLEAALMISILLAMTRKLQRDHRWITLGLTLGLVGAFLHASVISTVSEWFDDAGQEVTNASMQIAIYLLLLAINASLARGGRSGFWINLATSVVVALSIAREGFEIVIYLSGFAHNPENINRVLTGASLGMGVGFSIGALFYYSLLALSYRYALILSSLLLTLVGASMCSQATMLLMQVDWLPSQIPLWDSSGWVSENSLTGQLMYALMGYESTPSALQVGVYLTSLGIMEIVIVLGIVLRHRDHRHRQPATSTLGRGSASLVLVLVLAIVTAKPARADGSVVDKIYDPYVQPLEIELEWRTVYTLDGDDDALDQRLLHRLGLGRSVSDTWFVEGYLIASKNEEGYSDDNLFLEGYELEAKWQLTEQGEYDADWGLLFELESERDRNTWEFSTALLSVKEWGRWVGSANLFAIYEWGESIKNELESRISLQLRYRLSRSLEPALEFYAGQEGQSIGAVLQGTESLGVAKKIHWEAGALTGVSEKSPDVTFRALMEYEF